MRNSKIIFTALLGLGVLAAGCERDDEKPSFAISSPAENSSYDAGEKVHIEGDFTDNKELAIIHIFIANESGFSQPELVFDYLDKNIREKTQHVHEHFYVPEGVQGPYYLHFQVQDKEGHALATKIKLNIGS